MRLASLTLASAMLLNVGVALAQPVDPLAEVAELARGGEDARALRALSRLPAAARGTARARYLRGRLLERSGRLQAAAAAYPAGDAVTRLPDAVRHDAIRRRGVLLARIGACPEAREALAAYQADALVEAVLAECALALGELETAVTELRRVVARRAEVVDQFAARLALAEALSRSEARDEAVEVLTELVVERAEHPQIELAERALDAVSEGAVELTFSQRMQRVDRLAESRLYVRALAELDDIGRPSRRPDLRRYVHTRATVLYDSRGDYAAAAELFRESGRLGGAHAVDDQFFTAKALSRADRDSEAIREYRGFARRHRNHAQAPQASFNAAWLEIRHGMSRGPAAMRRFERSAAARRSPGLAREASWYLALADFEARRYRSAATGFERYAQRSDDVLVRARGLYWLGRAEQARRRRPQAIEAYRSALYVEPLHWYALLARQRLEALGEDPPPPFPEAAEEGVAPHVSLRLPEEVAFYEALGLSRSARSALQRHEAAIRRDAGAEGIALAYQRLSEPTRLSRLFGGPATTRRRATPGPVDRWRWDAAYPRPFADEVRAAAEPVGLTPGHLYAVMRQESGFDSDAVSYADAIGLMQLIEPTAERLAAEQGLTLRREMLFDPAINVRLGARYVASLRDRFEIPLAFAAFNAGEHRVAAWLEEQGRTELDLFVERIPFVQTRNYIRRVTTHLAHYRYLEDPDAGWPFELPTHVAPPETE